MYVQSYFHTLLLNKIVIVLNNYITFYCFLPGNGYVAVSVAVGAAVGGLIGGFIRGVLLTAVIAGVVFYRAKRKFTSKIEWAQTVRQQSLKNFNVAFRPSQASSDIQMYACRSPWRAKRCIEVFEWLLACSIVQAEFLLRPSACLIVFMTAQTVIYINMYNLDYTSSKIIASTDINVSLITVCGPIHQLTFVCVNVCVYVCVIHMWHDILQAFFHNMYVCILQYHANCTVWVFKLLQCLCYI